MLLFQPVCEGPTLLLSKQDIIATMAISWDRQRTSTSGYFILCALIRDFVGDSGSAYGLDKCHLASGCKKMIKSLKPPYKNPIFFLFSRGTALSSLGFQPSPLLLNFNLRSLPIALTRSVSAALVSGLCLWTAWNDRRDSYEITGTLFSNSLEFKP